MKRFVSGVTLALVLWAHAVLAQISGQGHWDPANAVIDASTVAVTGHVHTDVKCDLPPWSNFGAPMTCHFTIKLFQVAGENVEFYPGILQGRAARDVVWDDTGTSTPPARIGDPSHHGLRQWSGKFTVDPDPLFPHGWMNVVVSTVTRFTNGDSMECSTHVPYYSVLDVSKPLDIDHPALSSRCRPFSTRRPDVAWGANQMDVFNILPITAPFSAPWPVKLSAIRYGTLSGLPSPILRMVADLDLHNDIPGRILAEVVNPPDSVTLILDPAQLGPGPHKVAFMFTQPDGGLEQVTSLMVVDVVVSDDVPPPPPPPMCIPPDVLVNGQCVTPPPPPPPPPAAGPLPPGTYRLCDTAGKCVDLIVR